MTSIAQVLPVHTHAVRFPGDLDSLAFDPRVSIRTDLDPDLLGFCNGCELEGQSDARFRISFVVAPRPTQWVDVCGGCLRQELREVLDRGKRDSMFARPARNIVLHVASEHRPLPDDLHDLAGLGLPCEHQGPRGFDCPDLAEFTVATRHDDRTLTCGAHLLPMVRAAQTSRDGFTPVTVDVIPNAATERSAA